MGLTSFRFPRPFWHKWTLLLGERRINHPLGKNLIGAFYQPQCVVVDTDTLYALPDRELASGFAEVIKYGHMPSLMARDPAALAYAIKRSCENKAEVVTHIWTCNRNWVWVRSVAAWTRCCHGGKRFTVFLYTNFVFLCLGYIECCRDGRSTRRLLTGY